MADATCRDEILAALHRLREHTGRDILTGGQVYAEMLRSGTAYTKSTTLKTIQRMKEVPTRPPFAQLERVGTSGFRLVQAG